MKITSTIIVILLYTAPYTINAAGPTYPIGTSPYDPREEMQQDMESQSGTSRDDSAYLPPTSQDPDATSPYPERRGVSGGGTGARMCTPPPVSTPHPDDDCDTALVVGNGYGNYQWEAVASALDEAKREKCGGALCNSWVSSSCQLPTGGWYAYLLGYCWAPPIVGSPQQR